MKHLLLHKINNTVNLLWTVHTYVTEELEYINEHIMLLDYCEQKNQTLSIYAVDIYVALHTTNTQGWG